MTETGTTGGDGCDVRITCVHEVIETGATGEDGCDVRITYVHGVLILCSGTLLKGVP